MRSFGTAFVVGTRMARGRGRPGVAIVGVALAAVSSAFGAASLARPGTIRITDQQVRHTHVDVGRRGVSGGDLDLFRVVLFNRRITAKPIGHAEMVCTYTGSSSWSCAATYFLPRG